MRTISIVSRRRLTPFSNLTLCQPSITWWPEVPRPRLKRPSLMASSEAAVCAISVGERLKTLTMPVARPMRWVEQASMARIVKASQP